MSSNFELALKISLDAAKAESNLKRFGQAFDGALKGIGKTGAETENLKRLFLEVEGGAKSVEDLDEESRELFDTWRRGHSGAALLDGLGEAAAEATGDVENLTDEVKDNSKETESLGESWQKGGMALAAWGISAAAAIAFLKGTVTASIEADTNMRKLEGTIRATGGAAGFSAEEIRQFAEELDEATLGSRQVFEDAAAVLMTFRSVRGDNFKRALELAQDLASVMGGDATSAAMQLGKAMENPATGLSALNEAGVTFTNAQKEQIKALMDSGEEMKAHGIILDVVAKQVGGVAREMAGGAAGAVDTLAFKFGKFREAIGDALQPAYVSGIRAITSAVEYLTENLDEGINILRGFGAVALVAFAPAGAVALRAAVVTLTKALWGMAAALLAIGRAHPFLAAISVAAFGIGYAWDTLVEKFQKTKEGVSALGQVEGALRKASQGASLLAESFDKAIEKQKIKSDELASTVSENYKTISAVLKVELDRQLADIDRRYSAEKTALASKGLSEKQLIEETTRLTVQAEAEKIKAVEKWARQSEVEAKKAHDAIIELARSQGRDVTLLEQEALGERIKIYTQLENAYRGTVDRLIAEEQRLLGEARRADEERSKLKMSVEDRIRSLRQRAMTDEQAYADRQRQIDEKQAQAREQLQKGNFEQAKKLAEDAMSLAERNSSAVTKTIEQNGKQVTQTIVSQAQASAKAIGEIDESAKIADAALVGMGNSARGAAQKIGSEAKTAQAELDRIAKALEGMNKQATQAVKLKVDVDITAAEQAAARMKELIEGQELAVKLVADANELQAAIKERRFDAEVQLKAETFIAELAKLQNTAREQRIQLPAQLETGEAQATIQAFAADMKAKLGAPTANTHKVNPDDAAAKAAIRELQKTTTSRHIIYVSKVAAPAAGGLINDYVARFADGGAVFRRHLPGLLRGPGSGTSDSIPAMVSNGEYIIRAAMVRRFGRSVFDMLNAGIRPVGFAGGGLVGGTSAGSGSRDTIDINLRIGNRKLQLQGARDQAMALAGALRELSRGA